MEAITNILAHEGMTGVLILLLIFAIRKIYNQANAEDNESRQLEKEFREYLMETHSELTQIIKGNTEAFKEFSKSIIEFNLWNRQTANELNEFKRKRYEQK